MSLILTSVWICTHSAKAPNALQMEADTVASKLKRVGCGGDCFALRNKDYRKTDKLDTFNTKPSPSVPVCLLEAIVGGTRRGSVYFGQTSVYCLFLYRSNPQMIPMGALRVGGRFSSPGSIASLSQGGHSTGTRLGKGRARIQYIEMALCLHPGSATSA